MKISLFEQIYRESAFTKISKEVALKPIKSFINDKEDNYLELGSVKCRDGYILIDVFDGKPRITFDGVWRYPNKKVWLLDYCVDDEDKERLLNMNWLEAINDYASTISIDELVKGVYS